MPPSLNLTPARGPSVWDRMERDTKIDQCSLAMIVGGAMLTASALGRRRSASSRWAAAIGLMSVAAGCFYHSGLRLTTVLDQLRLPGATPVDDAIDRASSDSFPASDPPASIPASELRM